MICDYNTFLSALLEAGFSGAVGGSDDGVFGLFRYGRDAETDNGVAVSDSLIWHTGDPDTDPWEWRMRVLNERDDIAYAKMFFKKAGYITREWYPYFLAARRGGKTFDEEYSDGTMSNFAKRIYEAVDVHLRLPLHEIKRLAGFGREDASKFDAALNELQMRLYLTMCGGEQKLSRGGEQYGWFSTVFCKTETFWRQDVFERAAGLTAEEAADAISERIFSLNQSANPKRILKFIKG